VTKGTIQNVSYQYSVASGAANLLPNIGRFSIFSIGGTQTVTSLKFSSGVPKGADVACIGDSKTVGYYAANYAGSWCSLLQGLGYRAYPLAGGYDTTTDLLSEVPEIEALAPKYAVLMIGGNDARNGVSSAIYEANIASIVSNLTGAGITVYVATYPVENSGVNMSTLNTWIAATYPSNDIDINNGFTQTGSGVPSSWLAGDSVHPAQVFHGYIAQTVAGRLQSDSVKQQFPYYATP
jgi:lysophospholipase L1-like esterase